MHKSSKSSSVYVTGLAHEYPSYSLDSDQFEDALRRLCPDQINTLGLQKLVNFNRKTGIASRPMIFDYTKCTKDDARPPPIDELSQIFRNVGVDLTASACRKAILEANVSTADITHVVAVTCTDVGNPGYDLFVCQKLQLHQSVERVLLHGVGCAGGLSALRAATNLAAAASQRGRPARVLVFACELCSLFMRNELQLAFQDNDRLHIAPALFSDAAAALIVCNELAIGEKPKPVFELLDYGSMVVPETLSHMSYLIKPNGMTATITRNVPNAAVSAITPLFNHLRKHTFKSSRHHPSAHLHPSNFDWAIHPGGTAILQGAQKALGLTDDHIRASLEVYRAYGNSSSPTVLIVLDQLRRMGQGRDHVVATSFGPGLAIEMFMMRRCHQDLDKPQLLGLGALRKGYILLSSYFWKFNTNGRGFRTLKWMKKSKIGCNV